MRSKNLQVYQLVFAQPFLAPWTGAVKQVQDFLLRLIADHIFVGVDK